MNKNIFKLILIVVAVVGGMIALAGWLKSVSPEKVQPNADIQGEQVFVREGNYMTGNMNAKVILVEFADFQCPACAAHHTPIKSIVEKYRSNPNFNFVYRNFPLPSHANAKISANAAEAAGSQGKYWEMIEKLYIGQDDWKNSINPINTFVSYAQELGLNIDVFREEVASSKYINKITQDFKDGQALGVNGTPTFFLNGERLGNIADLDSRIQTLLQ